MSAENIEAKPDNFVEDQELASKGSLTIRNMVIVGVVALVLVGATVGGYMLMNGSEEKGVTTGTNGSKAPDSTGTSVPPALNGAKKRKRPTSEGSPGGEPGSLGTSSTNSVPETTLPESNEQIEEDYNEDEALALAISMSLGDKSQSQSNPSPPPLAPGNTTTSSNSSPEKVGDNPTKDEVRGNISDLLNRRNQPKGNEGGSENTGTGTQAGNDDKPSSPKAENGNGGRPKMNAALLSEISKQPKEGEDKDGGEPKPSPKNKKRETVVKNPVGNAPSLRTPGPSLLESLKEVKFKLKPVDLEEHKNRPILTPNGKKSSRRPLLQATVDGAARRRSFIAGSDDSSSDSNSKISGFD